MKKTTIIVKLSDLILDADRPGDAASLPRDAVIARLQKAYGFLAANMTFDIADDHVVITVDTDREHEVADVKQTFDKAISQAESGRFNKAVDLFRRVLAIVPEHADARRNLAMALVASGRQSEAKDVLVDVLRLDPGNAWAYVLLGNIFAKHEGNLPVAERYLTKAYELSKEDVYAATSLAALKTGQGDFPGATKLYEEAVRINPSKPNSYYGLAVVLGKSDRMAEALAALEQMFSVAQFDDVRMRDLLKECRETYLRLCVHVSDQQHDELWRHVMSYRLEAETETGAAFELTTDESIGSTAAISQGAWERGGASHLIRYNPSGKAVVPALVAREIARVLLRWRARREGKLPRIAIRNPGNEAAGSLLSRIMEAPENLLVDYVLHRDVAPLRPSLFVDMYLRHDEMTRVLDAIRSASDVPGKVTAAFEAVATVSAFFTDALVLPRSSYGSAHASSGFAPRARELADDWFGIAGDPSWLCGMVADLADATGLREHVEISAAG